MLASRMTEKINTTGMNKFAAASVIANEATDQELIAVLRTRDSFRYARIAQHIENHLSGEKLAADWPRLRQNAEIAVAAILTE